MFIKRLFTLFFALLLPILARANDDSQAPPVCSVITVAPGNDLAALFGHTAIRIRDPRLTDVFGEGDIWFDYGVFNPKDWTFWVHYAKGDAKYLLMAARAEDRLADYKDEGREVVEQELDLKPEEVRKLEDYLIENLRHPEYEYRFLDDNCTTRAKVAIEVATGEKLTTDMRNWSYRRFTDCHLSAQPFVQLGANLLMGAHAEQKSDVFLPALLQDAIQSSARPLVPPDNHMGPHISWDFGDSLRHLGWTLLFLGVAFVAFLSLAIPTLLRHKKKKPLPRRSYLDFLLFLSIGAIGCLMTFLGFWSHHPELGAFNWNLIWCWPTHLIFAFFFLFAAHGKYFRPYARIACIGASCAAMAYFFVPQALPVPLFPLVLLLAVRAWRWGWAAPVA